MNEKCFLPHETKKSQLEHLFLEEKTQIKLDFQKKLLREYSDIYTTVPKSSVLHDFCS